MSVIPITCDNCGAKYRLPETFTGTQAKCQKCGSVIDVQKQRGQAETPASTPAAAARPAAAAKPASAARPAVDRSKEKEAPKAAARSGHGDRAGSRRGHGEHGPGEHGHGHDKHHHGHHGHREHGKKKGNSMLLAMSGIGVLAIVVVVIVMMNSGNKPAEQTNAKTDTTTPANPAAKAPAANPAAKTDTAAAAAKTDGAPAAGTTPAEAPKTDAPTEAPKTPTPTPTPAETPKAADASTTPVDNTPPGEKRPWQRMKNPPASMDDVADPKAYGEVQWPAEIDEATKKQIQDLAADAAGDGLRSVRAKDKLEKLGYGAIFGIVERLRLLNYKETTDSMVAFDLNKLLERITGGLNARFEPVEANETILPAKAEWNTRSVNGWLGLLAKYPDAATFKKDKAERLKKQAGDDQ